MRASRRTLLRTVGLSAAADFSAAARMLPSMLAQARPAQARSLCALLPFPLLPGVVSRRCFSSGGGRPVPLPAGLDEARVHFSYHVLRVSVGADVATIKASYKELAKQLHPDSRTGSAEVGELGDAGRTADASDFQRVHEAYTYLTGLHSDVLRHVGERQKQRSREGGALDLSGHVQHASEGGSGSSSQPVPNAAHANVVQNRAYLRNEGVGSGHSPMERDKQYRSHRLSRGVSGAMDYRANQWSMEADRIASENFGAATNSTAAAKELAAFDSLLSVTRAAGTKHISSTIMIEEAIKDAMGRWDPREIKDFGKPLSHLESDSGSLVDPLEAKLNAILLRNGVLPDWMQLERQIDSDHRATLAELHYVFNEFVSSEQWHEGNKIKQQTRQHAQALKEHEEAMKQAVATAAVTPVAAAAPTSPSANDDTAAAASSAGDPTAASTSRPSPPSPPTLPPLSAVAQSLNLSYSEPFGPAWALAVREFHASLRAVNTQVDTFNVAVPSLSRQRCHFPSQGVVESVEAQAPNRALVDQAQVRVRERLAAFRASKRGAAKKKLAAATGSHIAASAINGGVADPLDVGWSTLRGDATAAAGDSAGASLPFSSVATIDTADLSDVEMEQLYRSLSGTERTELAQAEARRQRLQQNTSLPPAVVAALVGGSVAVLAVPVWLARRSAARQHADDED